MPLPSFTVTGNLNDILPVPTGGELTTEAWESARVVFTHNIKRGVLVWDDAIYNRPQVLGAFPDADGSIAPIVLLANDAGLNVSGIQWTATVLASGNSLTEIVFNAPADGGTVNLATVTPVPYANPVGITRGPAGAGIDDVQLDGDDVNFYVEGEIVGTLSAATLLNGVIDGAPGALNTLNELAAALGDDANFAATVTGLINAKSRLSVDGSFVSTYDIDTTALTAGDVDAYTDTQTDAAIIAALLTPVINSVKDSNGNTLLDFLLTASAVNYLQIVNNAAGGAPQLRATGADTNVSVFIGPKAGGHLVITVNTGQTPTLRGAGSDTNHHMNVVSKGTGVVQANGVEVLTHISVHALTGKTTPVDADELALVDSAASNVMKKLTWANLKATIKSYYDTVASTLTNKSIDLASNTVTGTTAQFNTANSDGDFATLAGAEAFTNKTVGNSNTITARDDRFTLQDNGDPTKQVVFQLSGIATGTTRTLTVPDSDLTLGAGGGGGGDASTNTSSSVDSEIVLFSGTAGKTLKRASGSGLAKITSGVLGTATAGTDYVGVDANGNAAADAFIANKTSTPTAAGVTTLTIADTQTQVFTGSSTQTVKLPTTSVTAGMFYTFVNQSSGTLTIQSSGANTISTVAANKVGVFTAVVDTPTTAANWIPCVVTPSAQASTVTLRDASANILANNFIPGQAFTPTAAGTTTLTISSNQTQVFTGSTTQTMKLPTTSVAAGQTYTVINQSSGIVTVQSSNADTVTTVPAGTATIFLAKASTPTLGTDWQAIT